jgi:hypothetical protein
MAHPLVSTKNGGVWLPEWQVISDGGAGRNPKQPRTSENKYRRQRTTEGDKPKPDFGATAHGNWQNVVDTSYDRSSGHQRVTSQRMQSRMWVAPEMNSGRCRRELRSDASPILTSPSVSKSPPARVKTQEKPQLRARGRVDSQATAPMTLVNQRKRLKR